MYHFFFYILVLNPIFHSISVCGIDSALSSSFSKQTLHSRRRADLVLDLSCSVGTFEESDGVCAECPMGFYQDENAQTLCKSCPGGWRQGGTARTFCATCQSGRYAPPAHGNCGYCTKPQEYTDESGADQCKICDGIVQVKDSSFSEGIGCIPTAAPTDAPTNSPSTSSSRR